MSMPCPSCGQSRTATKDSRLSNGAVRRRRQCACGVRFTTYEYLDTEMIRKEDAIAIVTGAFEGIKRIALARLGEHTGDDGSSEAAERSPSHPSSPTKLSTNRPGASS